jgi:hypothetical protein
LQPALILDVLQGIDVINGQVLLSAVKLFIDAALIAWIGIIGIDPLALASSPAAAMPL